MVWSPEFPIFDYIGSLFGVYELKDVNGVPDLVIDRIYAYEDFGKQIVLSGNNSDRTGYINKELDSESNLSDHGVRKYDNTLGRFITPDALWEKYYAWSPYNYSANNPVNMSDGNGYLRIPAVGDRIPPNNERVQQDYYKKSSLRYNLYKQ